ncbi:hypothetical protein RDI58_000968 [Solanum bulbocastanum]|uniref:Uncharacterized protein n=1 Tax=Solanum bulbocastanum TaxID=147425 RepID=A0AAN8U483_SOLBU
MLKLTLCWYLVHSKSWTQDEHAEIHYQKDQKMRTKMDLTSAGEQQLELLPGGLRGVFAGGTLSDMERLLREAREGNGRVTEQRREGEEEKGERKRGTSPPLVASPKRLRGKGGEEKERRWRRRKMNCLRVLGPFGWNIIFLKEVLLIYRSQNVSIF